MSAGIYIHIPFCKRKCPYCDFYSVPASPNTISDYVTSLIQRISQCDNKSISADTVYFGGGTPSLLTPNQVKAVLDTLKNSYNISSDCEITMECNPSSTTFDTLQGYFNAGVNRLSFGVQSSDDKELYYLGRLHDFTLAQRAVLDAQKAGFVNISCDIMIGTPNQTVDSLMRSVRDIAALGVTHISCYMLKIEEGTAYDCDEIRKTVADDDVSADMYLALVNELEKLGYMQYEISNFAKKGYESRHNTKYWIGQEYIGFGPSAHSYVGGKRLYCDLTVEEFIRDPFVKDAIEDASPNPLEEYILLGLRLTEGINFDRVFQLGGNAAELISAAAPYCKEGYCIIKDGKLFLTPQGFLVSNAIISRMIAAAIGENE